MRPLRPDELAVTLAVIAGVGLFPPEMLPEMAAPFFGGSDVLWPVAEGGAGLACVAPERLTDGTWDLLLLAVDPAPLGQDLGCCSVAAVGAG